MAIAPIDAHAAVLPAGLAALLKTLRVISFIFLAPKFRAVHYTLERQKAHGAGHLGWITLNLL
jgi:hypothetical protein